MSALTRDLLAASMASGSEETTTLSAPIFLHISTLPGEDVMAVTSVSEAGKEHCEPVW